MSVAYGIVVASAFGFLINMWFWPSAAGSVTTSVTDPGIRFVAGDPVVDKLHRFFLFTIGTSELGWDTGRAVTNTIAILAIGRPVLSTRRRAHRKAALHARIGFDG